MSSEGSLGIPTRTGWGRHGVKATLADAELNDLRLESWKMVFFTETQHRSAFSSPSLNPGRASSKKAGAEPLAPTPARYAGGKPATGRLCQAGLRNRTGERPATRPRGKRDALTKGSRSQRCSQSAPSRSRRPGVGQLNDGGGGPVPGVSAVAILGRVSKRGSRYLRMLVVQAAGVLPMVRTLGRGLASTARHVSTTSPKGSSAPLRAA